MSAPEITAAEERAVDQHIESLWELLRTGREVAIVHRGAGRPAQFLPAWAELDEGSQFAFMALAMGPLLHLTLVAQAIADELDNPNGDPR